MPVLRRRYTRTPGAVPKSDRTPRSSRYGYGCLTELSQVPGTGMEILNSQKFRVQQYGSLTELTQVPGEYRNVVHVPRLLCGRTEHTQVLATGMYVVQNSHKFQVRAWMSYITQRSSGKGNTRENTPGMVLYVPYRTQLLIFPA